MADREKWGTNSPEGPTKCIFCIFVLQKQNSASGHTGRLLSNCDITKRRSVSGAWPAPYPLVALPQTSIMVHHLLTYSGPKSAIESGTLKQALAASGVRLRSEAPEMSPSHNTKHTGHESGGDWYEIVQKISIVRFCGRNL